MADIKNLKITEDKTRGKHVADLPVNPTENGMSAQELQGHFDALPKVAIEAFNDLVDALEENGAGDKITPQSVGARPDTWMPNASDVGALNLSPFTLTGEENILELLQGFYNCEGLDEETMLAMGFPHQTWKAQVRVEGFWNIYPTKGYVRVWFNDISHNRTLYRDLHWETWHDWKEVFLSDGSVAMSDSALWLNNKYGLLETIHTTGSRLNVAIYDKNENTNNGRILTIKSNLMSDLSHSMQLRSKVDGIFNDYIVFGEHNKPSGSYTGNGSATERVIDTGGIGNLVMIYCSNGTVAELGPYGGYAKTSTGSVIGITRSNGYYSSGDIHLTTTIAELNASGQTYIYECK